MKQKILLSSRTKSDVLLRIDDVDWGALPRQAPLSLLGREEGVLEADAPQLAALKDEITRHAWSKLLRYLASRERSRQECWRYLDRTRVHHTIRTKLLDRAAELRYLDDARFARMFVTELQRKGKSRRAAMHSLRQRGIDEPTAGRVMQEVFKADDEQEAVLRAARMALRRTAGKPRRERWEKAMASMARKGFDYEDASRAIMRLLDGEGLTD